MMLTFDPIWYPNNPEIIVNHIKRKDGVAEYYYEEPNEEKTNLTVRLNLLKHLEWITCKENETAKRKQQKRSRLSSGGAPLSVPAAQIRGPVLSYGPHTRKPVIQTDFGASATTASAWTRTARRRSRSAVAS